MARSILSLLAGYAAWTVTFLGGSAGLRAAFASSIDADGGTDSAGLLLVYLLLSFAASVVAGFVTVRIVKARGARHALILGALLLATGIPVQLSAWETLPVWYHVAFLAGLVPLTLLGGRIAGGAAR